MVITTKNKLARPSPVCITGSKVLPFPDQVQLVSWKLNFEIFDFHPASFVAAAHNSRTWHMTCSSYFHEKLSPAKHVHQHQKFAFRHE